MGHMQGRDDSCVRCYFRQRQKSPVDALNLSTARGTVPRQRRLTLLAINYDVTARSFPCTPVAKVVIEVCNS
jgi:hypothetical protein